MKRELEGRTKEEEKARDVSSLAREPLKTRTIYCICILFYLASPKIYITISTQRLLRMQAIFNFKLFIHSYSCKMPCGHEVKQDRWLKFPVILELKANN